jgi:hypothetical protein
MIYFIISIIIIIFLLFDKLHNNLKYIRFDMEKKKYSDEAVMNDLKELRKMLHKVDDPKTKIEIIKKIEIISSFYN